MRRSKLSVSGEMIYPLSVLTPIRRLFGVTPSTDTLNRVTQLMMVLFNTRVHLQESVLSEIPAIDCAIVTGCKSERRIGKSRQ